MDARALVDETTDIEYLPEGDYSRLPSRSTAKDKSVV